MEKGQIYRALLVYTLGLFLGCMLSLERLTPWYESRVNEEDLVLRSLRAGQRLGRDIGLFGALDAMDCSLSFLFHETYKDMSKCRDAASSTREFDRFKETYRNADLATRRDLARTVRARLNELARSPEGLRIAWPATQPLTQEAPGRYDLALAADTAQPPEDKNLVKKPIKSVLVIGDSLALGLAPSIEKSLQRFEGVAFARVGKVSSGLASPHIYDWEKNLPNLLAEHKPDLLVVIMGVNDANNNIRFGDTKAIVGTPVWPEAYQKRVESFLQIIGQKTTPVYWIGLPCVRDTEMSARIAIANEAAKKACEGAEGCRFVETWPLLTDDKGEYTNFRKDDRGYNVRIRAKDGVHFSTEGGDMLSEHILGYISKYVDLKPKKESEQHI
jgi:hypothetical protein